MPLSQREYRPAVPVMFVEGERVYNIYTSLCTWSYQNNWFIYVECVRVSLECPLLSVCRSLHSPYTSHTSSLCLSISISHLSLSLSLSLSVCVYIACDCQRNCPNIAATHGRRVQGIAGGRGIVLLAIIELNSKIWAIDLQAFAIRGDTTIKLTMAKHARICCKWGRRDRERGIIMGECYGITWNGNTWNGARKLITSPERDTTRGRRLCARVVRAVCAAEFRSQQVQLVELPSLTALGSCNCIRHIFRQLWLQWGITVNVHDGISCSTLIDWHNFCLVSCNAPSPPIHPLCMQQTRQSNPSTMWVQIYAAAFVCASLSVRVWECCTILFTLHITHLMSLPLLQCQCQCHVACGMRYAEGGNWFGTCAIAQGPRGVCVCLCLCPRMWRLARLQIIHSIL